MIKLPIRFCLGAVLNIPEHTLIYMTDPNTPPFNVVDASTGVAARKLTIDEINLILDGVPDINSAVRTAGNFTRRKLMSELRKSLRKFVIVPEMIDELRDEIYSKMNTAMMPIGKPIGFTALEAIIQPIQQMALNSFHAAGSAKNVAIGVRQITAIISASENPPVLAASVHFNDRHLSVEDVLNKRANFVGIRVSDIYTSFTIDTPNHILDGQIPWWYVLYERINGNLPTRAAIIMRLTLDTNKVYIHDIDVMKVCKMIEGELAVRCVHSPILQETVDGRVFTRQYIDIYPLETQIPISKLKIQISAPSQELNNKYIDSTYFEIAVIPSMTRMYIKGIEGIQDLVPVEKPIWSIIANQEPITNPPPINPNIASNVTPINPGETRKYTGLKYWKITANTQRQRMSGISLMSIADLCTYVGMTVIDYVEESDIVFDRSQLYGIDDSIINVESYLIIAMPDMIPIDMRLVTKDRKLSKPVRKYSVNQFIEGEDIIFGDIKPNELILYYKKLDTIANSEYVTDKITQIIRKNNESLALRERALDTDLTEQERKHLELESTRLLSESRAITPARPTSLSKTFRMLTYVYADTVGTNLEEIMKRDDVNPDYTYSSNMYEILSILGVEAARNFLIKSINDSVKFEGYINPMAIVFLADFMTYLGRITKMTHTGHKGQKTNALSYASQEQAMTVLRDAAIIGVTDETKSTSVRVILGSQVRIGTGAGMTIDAEEERKINAMLDALDNGDNVIPLDVNEIEDAINGQDLSLNPDDAVVPELYFEGFNPEHDSIAIPSGASIRPGASFMPPSAISNMGARLPPQIPGTGMSGGFVSGVPSSLGGLGTRTVGGLRPGIRPGISPRSKISRPAGSIPGLMGSPVTPGRSSGMSSGLPVVYGNTTPSNEVSGLLVRGSPRTPRSIPGPFQTSSRDPPSPQPSQTGDDQPLISTNPTPSNVLKESVTLVSSAPINDNPPFSATQFSVSQTTSSPRAKPLSSLTSLSPGIQPTMPSIRGNLQPTMPGISSGIRPSMPGIRGNLQPTMPGISSGIRPSMTGIRPSMPGIRPSQTATIPNGMPSSQAEASLGAAISNAKTN